ncbi:hypothetical protein VTJ49DRAFT_5785 [Mycothermus thermophilus]|uniref:Uncharacterized protein n=1 Tax=Humicola insolens TaxID=85995 RepID=A0ABR3VQ45_HUMIN
MHPQHECDNRGTYEPYLGAHTGCEVTKKDGLILRLRRDGRLKKTISFTINGQKYGLSAYFRLDDALNNRLLRPRHSPSWISLTPSIDFWAATPGVNAAWVIKIVHDSGVATSGNAAGWTQVFEVPNPNAANASDASGSSSPDSENESGRGSIQSRDGGNPESNQHNEGSSATEQGCLAPTLALAQPKMTPGTPWYLQLVFFRQEAELARNFRQVAPLAQFHWEEDDAELWH